MIDFEKYEDGPYYTVYSQNGGNSCTIGPIKKILKAADKEAKKHCGGPIGIYNGDGLCILVRDWNDEPFDSSKTTESEDDIINLGDKGYFSPWREEFFIWY